MLASHFHDAIVNHALTALPLILIGAAVLVVAWGSVDRRRRRIWSLLSTGILVAGLGGYRLAETGAMSHNHLCHAHHADSCYRHEDDHRHWFGGLTAAP